MARWTALALIAASLAAAPACLLGGHSSSSAPAAIGDKCLVGSWTLDQEVNTSGYTLNNSPVSVAGLAGAVVKFSANGDEVETFDGSDPLVGDAAGRRLAIMIGGSISFRIHADKGSYTETGSDTQLPTTATLDGVPINYQSSYTPASGTYECSSSQLTMVTIDKNQTTTWSPG